MSQRASHVAAVVALGLMTAALWTGGTGSAAEPAREPAGRGGVTYRIYCGSCHGKNAKGDGKLAESLRQRPADLTLLARNNGGVFDADAVRQAIDGRQEVAAHGDRDMPVWGLSFQQPGDGEAGTPEAKEEEILARLDDLVAYLATVQAPAEKQRVNR
jgi:mono/diheme cytochrome c family protein